MITKSLNLADPDFLSSFNEYCLFSKPYKNLECGSISLREENIKKYLKTLKNESDLIDSAINKNNKHSFFLFTKKKEDHLEIQFLFPNRLIKQTSKETVKSFYLLCIKQLEASGYEFLKGEILRNHKKQSYKKFLKRFVRAVSFDNENNITIHKEKLIKEYEKM